MTMQCAATGHVRVLTYATSLLLPLLLLSLICSTSIVTAAGGACPAATLQLQPLCCCLLLQLLLLLRQQGQLLLQQLPCGLWKSELEVPGLVAVQVRPAGSQYIKLFRLRQALALLSVCPRWLRFTTLLGVELSHDFLSADVSLLNSRDVTAVTVCVTPYVDTAYVMAYA
jgi:hypothetical protein